MHYRKIFFCLVVVLGVVYFFSLRHETSFKNLSALTGDIALIGENASSTDDVEPVVASVPMLPRKLDSVRAAYMTMYIAATPSKLEKLVAYAKKNNINAFVIDVKETEGMLFFPLDVYDSYADKDIASAPYLVKRGPAIIAKLREQGFYLIARVVAFPDNVYAKKHPDQALRYKSSGALWKDKKNNHWIDPASKEYWTYLVHVAKATAKVGFDEINFDYIRFPSDGSLKEIQYPYWNNTTPREEIIKTFFHFLSANFNGSDVTISGDLFGQVLVNSDDMGIGQKFEMALPYFDVIAPMTYPSHYIDGFAGYKNPAEHPYEIIDYSLKEAQKKLASSTVPVEERAQIRPWLQVFNIGAVYDGPMVRKQIKALEDNGLKAGYMLWSPSNVYPDFRD
ncbi:MAG: putative glycoside hydrolase [Patescibacteria group bacterium]